MSLNKGCFKILAEVAMELKGYSTVAGQASSSRSHKARSLWKDSNVVEHSTQHIFPPWLSPSGKFKGPRSHFSIRSVFSLVSILSVVTQLLASCCHGYQDVNWTLSPHSPVSLKPNYVARVPSVSSEDPAPGKGTSTRASEVLGTTSGNIQPSGHVRPLTVSSPVTRVLPFSLVSCSTTAWRYTHQSLSETHCWVSISIWVVTHQRRSWWTENQGQEKENGLREISQLYVGSWRKPPHYPLSPVLPLHHIDHFLTLISLSIYYYLLHWNAFSTKQGVCLILNESQATREVSGTKWVSEWMNAPSLAFLG